MTSHPTKLSAKVLAMSEYLPDWESRWYELYNHILIDSSRPSNNVVIAPQYTLDRLVTSNSRGREITRWIRPDFMAFRITGNMHGPEDGMRRTPIMVSEGKRGDEAEVTGLMRQCWEQASYCFEEFNGLSRLTILTWEGRDWKVYAMRRSHRRVLSDDTDPGYVAREPQALPLSLRNPVASGSITDFSSLDYAVQAISEHM